MLTQGIISETDEWKTSALPSELTAQQNTAVCMENRTWTAEGTLQ